VCAHLCLRLCSHPRPGSYPNLLILAGLYDPRVAYWEPTKWASKLRTLKTDGNDIIMKMDTEAGHFSASDRYKYLREKAFEQAVVLDKLGLAASEIASLPVVGGSADLPAKAAVGPAKISTVAV